MILSFELTMPHAGSWNGKWSGAGNLYARVINFGASKKAAEKANSILSRKAYFYNFGDGWTARVVVRKVDSKEAARIRKLSKGFCGYDWMIHSIRDKGHIEA